MNLLDLRLSRLPAHVPVLFPRISGTRSLLHPAASADLVRHELLHVLSEYDFSPSFTPLSFRAVLLLLLLNLVSPLVPGVPL